MIVKHYTYYSERVLHTGLSFEEAKALCQKYAADEPSDGLGQSKREIVAPMTTKVPFQIKIETMTAEAGDVLDLYTVEQEPLVRKVTLHLDERFSEGKEIVNLVTEAGLSFSVIPMSGVPELIDGLARYVGLPDIKSYLRARNY